MAHFETKYLFNHPTQPLHCRQYLDDIFFIWQHFQTEQNNIIQHLNSFHQTIKFTHSTEITYLDLDIYIYNNKLETKTHFKSTNTFSYLHGKSNHPPLTFKGVYIGENIRIPRNTSEQYQYDSTMKFITDHFKKKKISITFNI